MFLTANNKEYRNVHVHAKKCNLIKKNPTIFYNKMGITLKKWETEKRGLNKKAGINRQKKCFGLKQ